MRWTAQKWWRSGGAFAVGPARPAEELGVGQHWGMGGLGVVCMGEEGTVCGRIRVQFQTWTLPLLSPALEAGSPSGFCSSPRTEGLTGLQLEGGGGGNGGGAGAGHSRETGKKPPDPEPRVLPAAELGPGRSIPFTILPPSGVESNCRTVTGAFSCLPRSLSGREATLSL